MIPWVSPSRGSNVALIASASNSPWGGIKPSAPAAITRAGTRVPQRLDHYDGLTSVAGCIYITWHEMCCRVAC